MKKETIQNVAMEKYEIIEAISIVKSLKKNFVFFIF